jgi:hypothetical protein
MSVMPFIDQNHAPAAADMIRDNMEIADNVKPVRDGYREVQRLISDYVENHLELSVGRRA